MGFSRGSGAARRVRWLVVFTLLFVASAAVPMLAQAEGIV